MPEESKEAISSNEDTKLIDSDSEKSRRDFLKKLGKYSVATSTATATLIASQRTSAMSGAPPI